MKNDQLKHTVIGNKGVFAIGYAFQPREPNTSENWPMHQCTEMTLFVDGVNLLGFMRGSELITLRWQLDEAVEFLDEFARNSREEPFPYPDVPGNTLAELDYNAHDFESDDIEASLNYYEKLDDYVWPRSWHHTCSEAVFPDIYYRVLGQNVEVSWDNQELEEGEDITFISQTGHALVPLATFRDVVSRFVAAYLKHWGGYAWDQTA